MKLCEKIWWWLPTKSDQQKYREEELERINKEYVLVFQELMDLQNKINLLENQLKNSLSKIQMPIYMDLKVAGEKAFFLKIKLITLRHEKKKFRKK